MSWIRILKSAQVFFVHTLLFCFTILLLLKLDHIVSYSWWIIFFPLLLFHAVVARGWFPLPGSSFLIGHHVHFLVAFELLLCVYLESAYVKNAPSVSLKIVFLPLLAFEVTIAVRNLRMGIALLGVNDTIWLSHGLFCVTISIGFFFAGTILTLRKLSGYTSSLNWWHSFICFGIAECIVFLVCIAWSNAWFHRNSQIPRTRTVESTEEISENRMCGLGGHVIIIPILVFQILLCLRLEGKPAAARFISLPVVFSPIFIAQGLRVLFAASNLIKKVIILLPPEIRTGVYFTYAGRACYSFLQRGFRLFVWRSTDEGSNEEEVQMPKESSGYKTFSGEPSDVEKLSKEVLTEEVWRLRAALKQKEIIISTHQNDQTLKNDKITCKICCDGDINTQLIPCRHNLCSICSEKSENCPFCRAIVKERWSLFL